ncbi:MAG: hypothetical protein OXC08_20670 [Thiotrichales bacterium]|nr:hypothetical protein [Thiotrichales bacterium]
MSDTWFISRSGVQWDVLDMRAEDIEWPDVAESLSKTCRFNGHCRHFYSVAQHSQYVADLLPHKYRLYGLLHDAHEAWTGDIIRPVKNLLGDVIKDIENRLDVLIYQRAGLPYPDQGIKALVKEADLRMLETERRDLISVKPGHRLWTSTRHVQAAGFVIRPNEWKFARDAWLQDVAEELEFREATHA